MEFEQFESIQDSFCTSDGHIMKGKMMSSPAIQYKDKVFAFLSLKNKMVFKLGKDYTKDEEMDVEIKEFSPFKNKNPLNGWYEMDYISYTKWQALATKALNLIRAERPKRVAHTEK